MSIRTNARRRARFSARIRQVGVDVTGARLGESDGSSSIAGSLWYYCALRLLDTTLEHVLTYVYVVLSGVSDPQIWESAMLMTRGTSVRGWCTPAAHRPTDWQYARAQRRICNGGLSCFPSVPSQVGRARPPAIRPLQSVLSRTRDSRLDVNSAYGRV